MGLHGVAFTIHNTVFYSNMQSFTHCILSQPYHAWCLGKADRYPPCCLPLHVDVQVVSVALIHIHSNEHGAAVRATVSRLTEYYVIIQWGTSLETDRQTSNIRTNLVLFTHTTTNKQKNTMCSNIHTTTNTYKQQQTSKTCMLTATTKNEHTTMEVYNAYRYCHPTRQSTGGDVIHTQWRYRGVRGGGEMSEESCRCWVSGPPAVQHVQLCIQIIVLLGTHLGPSYRPSNSIVKTLSASNFGVTHLYYPYACARVGWLANSFKLID